MVVDIVKTNRANFRAFSHYIRSTASCGHLPPGIKADSDSTLSGLSFGIPHYPGAARAKIDIGPRSYGDPVSCLANLPHYRFG